jgi:hypothetical protein
MPEDEKYDVLEKIGTRLRTCLVQIGHANAPQAMAPLASSARSSASRTAMYASIATTRIMAADRGIDPVPQGDQLPEDVAQGARTAAGRALYPQGTPTPQHRRLFRARSHQGVTGPAPVHGVLREWRPGARHPRPEKQEPGV